MNNKLVTSTLIAVLLWCLSVHAHHGPASNYDLSKMITVTGVVTNFKLINPYARIYFDVTADNGEVGKWLAEGNAAAVLKRCGWKKDTLKAGDLIQISGNLARDGGNKMDWKSIILEDGTELRSCNTVASERDRQLDELRIAAAVSLSHINDSQGNQFIR